MNKAILIVIVATVVIVGTGSLLYMIRPSSRVLLLLFPPADIGDPLVRVPVDLSQSGREYIFPFKNKYVGNHSIDFIIEKTPPFGVNYEFAPKIAIKIFSNNQLLLSKTIDAYQSRVFSGRNNSGEILVWYEVPEDLPRNKPLICKLTILRGEKAFHKGYGSVLFVIRKRADL